MSFKKRIDQEEKINLQSQTSINVNQKDGSRSNEDSIKAVAMIRSYRQRGHLIAKLDPLNYLNQIIWMNFIQSLLDLKKKIIKKKFI